LDYLREGYRAFFSHADRSMKVMADLIRSGRAAEEIMAARREENGNGRIPVNPGRNDTCFCGSGLKFER
jgi:uncharacterized protein YecA (UPF0149 family)